MSCFFKGEPICGTSQSVNIVFLWLWSGFADSWTYSTEMLLQTSLMEFKMRVHLSGEGLMKRCYVVALWKA